MTLSSGQLEAFAAVVKSGSFSLAARQLHLTQSALSQRVMNLEAEVGTALLVRETAGLRLTTAGEEMFRYCERKASLEAEMLARISSHSSELSGPIRIGAFASTLRSLVMPALTELIANGNKLQIDLFSRELHELVALLASGEADFILTSEKVTRQSVESVLVGQEEYVLIEPSKGKALTDMYFDHDLDDQTTLKFFEHQSGRSPANLARGYLDEVYAIIDAVALGWGKAVVPLHLIGDRHDVRRSSRFKPLLLPIYLSCYTDPYASRLHTAVRQALIDGIAKQLT